ncbi:MAG TPA: hypothetical protein VNC78_03195 [Actinomycetota bacterium]|nr:hypothetical protein [Actinomycetota bacterium]
MTPAARKALRIEQELRAGNEAVLLEVDPFEMRALKMALSLESQRPLPEALESPWIELDGPPRLIA